ncbi:TTN [Mytilus edulis]|uniref:TTN n=1 Tax=Mytilus edulis TaxID=6550 RepID=A0A8S3TZJ9_MYTED|nr:TTN [Mytilus edulis]
MTLVHVCAGFPLKCPEPAQWRLRANGHCVNPSTYFCLRNDIINGYSENCTRSDFQQAGRKSVLRGGIDAVVCSKERYQPSGYTLYTNASTNCILLKSFCHEEGQVVYDNGNRTTDATCRCDYRRGFAFLIKPNNPCFCRPSQADCSCFLKICPNRSHTLSPVTTAGEKYDVKETFPKEDNVSVLILGTLTLVLFILVICIRQFKAFENNGPEPELNLIEGDTLTLQYMLPIKRLRLCFFKDDTLITETVNVKKHVLEKTNVTLGDQGNYFAKVCKIRSRITKVTVQSMFTSEFNTIKCIEGEILQLKCSVYSEDINVELSKVDAKDKQIGNISMQVDGKDHSMTIQQAQLSDAGQYMMSAGNVQKPVTVTIAAMFTSEFNTIKCIEGEILQFKCSVYSEDINVELSKVDAKDKQIGNISMQVDGKDHCMTIQQAQLSDAGQYMMSAGNVQKPVTVTVEAMFTSEFNTIKCIEGEILQFKCSVYSEDINVELSKVDAKDKQIGNISMQVDGKDHCMTIQQAQLGDAGQYMMSAGNVQKPVTVTVEAMFTSEFNTIKCIEGEILQFKCSVYSEDINVELSKVDAKDKQIGNISMQVDGKDHCMTIQQAQLSDAGQYMMSAGNVQNQ